MPDTISIAPIERSNKLNSKLPDLGWSFFTGMATLALGVGLGLGLGLGFNLADGVAAKVGSAVVPAASTVKVLVTF